MGMKTGFNSALETVREESKVEIYNKRGESEISGSDLITAAFWNSDHAHFGSLFVSIEDLSYSILEVVDDAIDVFGRKRFEYLLPKVRT
jgi:hypothetical protein